MTRITIIRAAIRSGHRPWRPNANPVSLLWRILLSTSIAVTLLFGVTGWIVQDNATSATAASLDEEVRASFHAYDSLWRSRADMLASVSLVVSRMSDVRAAFSTGDAATIRDTAHELWDKISREDAIFLVTDPRGKVLASLGGSPTALSWATSRSSAKPPRISRSRPPDFSCPADTSIKSPSRPSTYRLDPSPASSMFSSPATRSTIKPPAGLKEATGGSEFLFISDGKVAASTLSAIADSQIRARSATARPGPCRSRRHRIQHARHASARRARQPHRRAAHSAFF